MKNLNCNKVLRLFVALSMAIVTQVMGQNDCKVVGWASQNGGTTGGGTAAATTVTTYNQLKSAVTSASVQVVEINGSIEIPTGGRLNMIDLTGKTIYGLAGSKLYSNDLTQKHSGIFVVKNCKNIIFRNVDLQGPAAYDIDGSDLMTIENSTNIWLDHCSFSDGLDGNLDIKKGSDFISITWCKFGYKKPFVKGGSGGIDDHRFSNLFGSSDAETGDRGKLKITLQYCWWAEGCAERMPWVRFGKVHIVNNFYNSKASVTCVRVGFEANLLIEKNVFENVNEPIFFASKNFTAVTETDNVFTSCKGNTKGSGKAFTPPYSLTKIPVSEVKSKVMAGAGATLKNPASLCIPVETHKNTNINHQSLNEYPTMFNQQLNFPQDSKVSYSIFDLKGVEILHGMAAGVVNTSTIVKGAYTVTIKKDGNVKSIRMLKTE